MARVIYPKDVKAISALIKAIADKHATNETVLKAFLIHHQIDLSQDNINIHLAEEYNQNHIMLSNQSENARQQRDVLFSPIFHRTKSIIQFLKSFYTPNYKALTQWGITVVASGKIIYPTAVLDQIKLFKKIKETNNSYPPISNPLTNYLTTNNINLATDALIAAKASIHNTQYQDLKTQSEIKTKQRDQLKQSVQAHLRLIGNYLKKLYGNNTKQLGLWGFEIDDNILTHKIRTTKLKPGKKITIKGAIIGGNFTNIGKYDISIYKGLHATGTPIIVSTTQSISIPKKYNTITVLSTNPQHEVIFQVLTSSNPTK